MCSQSVNQLVSRSECQSLPPRVVSHPAVSTEPRSPGHGAVRAMPRGISLPPHSGRRAPQHRLHSCLLAPSASPVPRLPPSQPPYPPPPPARAPAAASATRKYSGRAIARAPGNDFFTATNFSNCSPDRGTFLKSKLFYEKKHIPVMFISCIIHG